MIPLRATEIEDRASCRRWTRAARPACDRIGLDSRSGDKPNKDIAPSCSVKKCPLFRPEQTVVAHPGANECVAAPPQVPPSRLATPAMRSENFRS